MHFMKGDAGRNHSQSGGSLKYSAVVNIKAVKHLFQ